MKRSTQKKHTVADRQVAIKIVYVELSQCGSPPTHPHTHTHTHTHTQIHLRLNVAEGDIHYVLLQRLLSVIKAWDLIFT